MVSIKRVKICLNFLLTNETKTLHTFTKFWKLSNLWNDTHNNDDIENNLIIDIISSFVCLSVCLFVLNAQVTPPEFGNGVEWTEYKYFFKGTQGFPCCLFKAVYLGMPNKQIFSSLATYDALTLVHHKAQLHLVWLYKCWNRCSLNSKELVEERLSSYFVFMKTQ